MRASFGRSHFSPRQSLHATTMMLSSSTVRMAARRVAASSRRSMATAATQSSAGKGSVYAASAAGLALAVYTLQREEVSFSSMGYECRKLGALRFQFYFTLFLLC